MPGGRTTTRHADSALRRTNERLAPLALGQSGVTTSVLRHERKLVDGRDPIPYCRITWASRVGYTMRTGVRP
eukprot:3160801-Prymnesium_polylepis.1